MRARLRHARILTNAATALLPRARQTVPLRAVGSPILRWCAMTSGSARPEWFAPTRRYYALSHFLRRRFGGKVWRVTLDAGFTCPNVDGTVARGGCVYCDNRSFSPNRRLPRTTVRDQLARGVTILQNRYSAERFIAYFQAATNTYAPLEKLRRLYD